ncbi:MAG: hypothetical protein ACKPB0_06655 [Opitutaceae bacterium]
MAESAGYTSHLSSQAAALLISLPRRQQRRILDLADQLSLQPFRISDYQTSDDAGHEVDNLLLDDYLFTYWVDHAAKEVRITEILKV